MNTGFKREIPVFDLHLQTIHSFLSVTISFSRSADPMHMEAASRSNADTSRMNAQNEQYARTGTVIAVGDTHRLLPEGSTPLPPHLNGRSAVSLCAAAARKAPIPPDKLLPDYLAVTQAEKELEGGVKN